MYCLRLFKYELSGDFATSRVSQNSSFFINLWCETESNASVMSKNNNAESFFLFLLS